MISITIKMEPQTAPVTLSGTGNNVYNASLVRIINTTTSLALILQLANSNFTNGSPHIANTVLVGGTEISVTKGPTDLLESNVTSGVMATSIGYYY